jgi:hypothetical protein
MSIDRQDPFSLSQIMMSSLLLGMVLLLCTCWVHNMVTLLSWLVSPTLVHAHTSVYCIILFLFPCIW